MKTKRIKKSKKITVSKKQSTSLRTTPPKGYESFLETIKSRIHQSQTKAMLAVNKELILLYWEIGREIVERQNKEKWGQVVVERLSKDLRHAFPSMHGFSTRNLWDMRRLYLAYGQEDIILRQLVAELPWGHHLTILNSFKKIEERLWYMKRAIEHGWSRNALIFQIKSKLHKREGKAINNFKAPLPSKQSVLAEQTLKDPYFFDFLSLGEEAHERAIEDALVSHITRFLLELGAGFSFVGKQYHLCVEKQDYYIDLLFYHTRLHCYVAIELKAGNFKPEYAGQINFYLSALDDLVKTPQDNPSIGLILCSSKNKVVAEYALRDIKKPIGVSEYQITRSIPSKLRSSLPTVAELEEKLSKNKI